MKQPAKDHNSHFKYLWVTFGKWILSMWINLWNTELSGVPTAWWGNAVRYRWKSSLKSLWSDLYTCMLDFFDPALFTESWNYLLGVFLSASVSSLSISIDIDFPFIFLFSMVIRYKLLKIPQLRERWSQTYRFQVCIFSVYLFMWRPEIGLLPSISLSKAFQLLSVSFKEPTMSDAWQPGTVLCAGNPGVHKEGIALMPCSSHRAGFQQCAASP